MNADDDAQIATRISQRFRKRSYAGYARGKVRYDPAYAAVAGWIGVDETPLLDIGCGLGLLGFYLRERGWRGAYHGLDFDSAKIAAAREAAVDVARFEFDDSRAQVLPAFQGHVALIDVLHYLSAPDQQALLRQAADRVAPGALLIVRNVLRTPGWRFQLTRAEEWFIHAIGWVASPARHFPTHEEIETPLRDAGFVADVQPLWGGTPFNSFAIVARRPAD